MANFESCSKGTERNTNSQQLKCIPLAAHEFEMHRANKRVKRWMTISFILLGVISAIALKKLI